MQGTEQLTIVAVPFGRLFLFRGRIECDEYLYDADTGCRLVYNMIINMTVYTLSCIYTIKSLWYFLLQDSIWKYLKAVT